MHTEFSSAYGQLTEISYRPAESLIEVGVRLPLELRARECNVRASLARVVLRQWRATDFTGGPGHLDDLFSEFADREFLRIAEIDRAGEIVRALHQLH